MNKLIVLSGAPGSGKSYFSHLVRQYKKEHVYIISSDNLRTLIGGSQKNFDYEELMWKMFYDLVKVYSQDKQGIVILDATQTKDIYRVDTVANLKPLFNETDLIVFDIDKKIIREQNQHRDNPIPDDALEKIFDEFEYPTEKDKSFFNNIYTIKDSKFDNLIEEICK